METLQRGGSYPRTPGRGAKALPEIYKREAVASFFKLFTLREQLRLFGPPGYLREELTRLHMLLSARGSNFEVSPLSMWPSGLRFYVGHVIAVQTVLSVPIYDLCTVF